MGEIDGVSTMLLIDDKGMTSPVITSSEENLKTIGSDWLWDTGKDLEGTGYAYVPIVNESGDYQNPDLILWLMQFGARMTGTYDLLFISLESGLIDQDIRTLSCYSPDDAPSFLCINGNLETAISPVSFPLGYVYDCDYGMIPYNDVTSGYIRCDINSHDIEDYNYTNALICKALGINPIYLK